MRRSRARSIASGSIAVFTVACVAASTLFAVPARADALDDAIGKISSTMAAIKSVQYKTAYTTSTRAEGFETQAAGTTAAEYKRTAGGYLQRTEVAAESTQKTGGQTVTEKSTTLMVFDGKHHYTYTVSGDRKSAMKMPHNAATMPNPYDGPAVFALLRQTAVLKLLPDAPIDGKACFVIETKVKPVPGAPASNTRTLTYYDKKTGIVLKSVSYDAGQVIATSTTTEFKLNADIPDDRFAFTPPPGVQVIDVAATQAQANAVAAQSGKDAAAKKPAEKESAQETSTQKEPAPAAEKTAEKPEKKETKKGLGGLLKKLKLP